LEDIPKKISTIEGYQIQFKKVFNEVRPINLKNITHALAAFERTLVRLESPYDDFLGGKKASMGSLGRQGLELFEKIGCVQCHQGVNFSNSEFKKFPIYPNRDLEEKYHFSEDLGRYQVTKNDSDKNFWRVPTLRNIALTAPYFHNGSVSDLKQVVIIM